MKRNLIVLLTILVCGLTACKPGQKKEVDMEKETKLKIETSAGDIIVKLYNETPKHRDNFIKLVKEGQYNGLLFHRVIKDFMIQGGDVTSKDAPMNKQLGAGDLGYTVPAEFRYPKYSTRRSPLRRTYRRRGEPGKGLFRLPILYRNGEKVFGTRVEPDGKATGRPSETRDIRPPAKREQA